MNDMKPAGVSKRHRLAAGCAVMLLCGGITLLGFAARQFLEVANLSRNMPVVMNAATPLPDVAKLDSGSHDGKLLPEDARAGQSVFDLIPPQIEQRPIPEQSTHDMARLYTAAIPVHDYFAATEELGRVDLGDRVVSPTAYQIGDRATFNTNDGPRQAELVYADELAAYWFEIGLAADRPTLMAAAERLRGDYYPMLRRYVGQEWNPGVDGDPRLTVLHVFGAPDTYELGYFTDENEYPGALFAHSNQREMVYLNMNQLETGPLYDGTLVHEIQHLIQWNLDANEDKWFNEGLSQVMETIAGLDTVEPQPYLERTDIRLDRWTDEPTEIHAHYAASYLYMLYLWEQLGDAALTELARHPANGLPAVRAVLAGHRPDLSLETFTADWAAALYLDGKSTDPRYNIAHHELAQPFFSDRVRQLPYESVHTIEQFAVDYIDLDFSGPATITFAGDTVTELVNEPPGGGLFWYASPSNSSRSQLTAAVDLSTVANASLDFSAWYDLEAGYDFGYLSVSTDNGQTWRPLEPDHPILGAYGPSWGGRSVEYGDQQNGWLRESISLDAYVGQSILLRFDMVTDFEKIRRGFAVGSLSIPQLPAQSVWQPEGYVETSYLLPQLWQVRLIREDGTVAILPMTLDGSNRGQITVEPGSSGVLAVMPLTPFTDSTAEYWLSVSN